MAAGPRSATPGNPHPDLASVQVPPCNRFEALKAEGRIGPGSFLEIPVTRAPGRQHTSVRVGSGRHFGPSVPLRRESPTTITLLSFLEEAVKCGATSSP